MNKPRRLHRKLSPDGLPLFRITTGAGVFQDDDIVSISISHGNDGPQPDITPGTMSFEVNGAPFIERDTVVHVELSDWFSALVGTYGGGSAALVRDRFKGRKGQTDVRDEAWKRGVGAKFFTTVTCSNWTTLLRVARRTTSPVANENILTALMRAANHPAIMGYQSVDAPGAVTYDQVFANDPGLTFTEVVSKYGTDLGTLPQQRRNGSLRFLSILRRKQILTENLATQMPLLRSQGISPAEWSQNIESASKQLVNVRRLSTGAEFRQDWPLPSGSAPVILETEDVDMLHVKPVTESYRALMDSLNNEANSSRVELQSITVDMVHLLSSKSAVDRKVGAQVLALQAGDPIYLSYDWPEAIRAPYFANQIKETVTSDSWEFELSLYHPRDVLGLLDADVPNVPARVWDSAAYEWDTETREWNQA